MLRHIRCGYTPFVLRFLMSSGARVCRNRGFHERDTPLPMRNNQPVTQQKNVFDDCSTLRESMKNLVDLFA